tara:strand:- start:1182 stop:1640 length:459 start_codon:yes stop_codon:yes gene_type:complete
MVKSSSRPRRTSKFVVDLGPEIDKVVKKKNAKIKKQKVIILELQDKLRSKSDDMKVKKQKLFITSLQTRVEELNVKLSKAENEMKHYKIERVQIVDRTVDEAFKRIRKGSPLVRMIANTQRRIKLMGRWEEAVELNKRVQESKKRKIQSLVC